MSQTSKAAEARIFAKSRDSAVQIRRQWNDWREVACLLSDLEGLHWSPISGGVNAIALQPFVHGYIFCDEIDGEIAHSGQHSEGPHRIKVCIVKSANLELWPMILQIVGPKPKRGKY